MGRGRSNLTVSPPSQERGFGSLYQFQKFLWPQLGVPQNLAQQGAVNRTVIWHSYRFAARARQTNMATALPDLAIAKFGQYFYPPPPEDHGLACG